MKYVSIDIETTGLDTENYDILSIGAIIEDTKNPKTFEESPKFHAAIKRRGSVTGELFALNMNKDLIESISSYQHGGDQTKLDIERKTGLLFYYEEEVAEAFFRFLWRNEIPQENFPADWFMNGQNINIIDGVSYPVLSSKLPKTYLNVAGKNFGTFDLKFLSRLPRWQQIFRVRNRILDPAILHVDWDNDDSLPGLDLCKERAEVGGRVTHNALEDAWDVILTLRPSYKK